jgi:hypothetical protein|tara:strand:- start:3274 stop:3525 length:252 start_codon:yes stop_codon:yes gene_type:complete
MGLILKVEAKKLVDSFYDTEYCGIKHFPNDNFCECIEMSYYQAKQCALIHVNGVIKERQILNNDFDRERIKELLEIKQEINKI